MSTETISERAYFSAFEADSVTQNIIVSIIKGCREKWPLKYDNNRTRTIGQIYQSYDFK
jgi:hypothetical protein